MQSGIQLQVVQDDDGDGFMSFQMRLSTEETATSLVFWGYDDEFQEFAKSLTSFPQSSASRVCYQVGDDKNERDNYLRLEVFCYEPTGAAAICICCRKGQQAPDYERHEFSIRTLPADLNRLGQLLAGWNPLTDSPLNWHAHYQSEIY